MSTSISYISIWKLTLPIIISGVSQNLVTVIDTLFLSRLGNIALGAAGNGALFYFLIVTIGLGISTGAQLLMGNANGAKEYQEIGKIVKQTFYLFIPTSILLFVGLQFLYPYIAESISQSVNIADAAITFVKYRSFGLLFAFINFLFIAFFVATKNTKVLFYASLSIAFTNIILDYGLIFGHFGLPTLNIAGAAIASVISEFIGVIFFVVYCFKKVDFKFYNISFSFHLNWKNIQSILSISTPIVIQNSLTFGSWFVFFSIIEQLGENELAISHVIRSIYMVMMIPLLGFSTAVNTLVSNLIGANQSQYIFILIKRMLVLTLISSAVVVLITTSFGREIILFYELNNQLIEATLHILSIINVVLFFFSVAFILFNALVGTGKTKVSLLIESINITIYLTSAYILVNYFSPNISEVWCVEFIYFGCLAIMSFLYLKYGKWNHSNLSYK